MPVAIAKWRSLFGGPRSSVALFSAAAVGFAGEQTVNGIDAQRAKPRGRRRNDADAVIWRCIAVDSALHRFDPGGAELLYVIARIQISLDPLPVAGDQRIV
jgi:hypothetical protein